MTLDPGTILNNRYRIAKQIGKGGFGAVYRAWDLNLNKSCALKENLETSPEAQKQFFREAEILANLKHPNLPRVTDHFTIPNQGQYLVMDYIEGENLDTLIKQSGGQLQEEQAIQIIQQVSSAVSYMHEQKPPIIHRDIKPGNIIITPNGQALLVDFGIVKIFNTQLSTTLGARAYSPGYSPPEQYGQGGTDTRSDVYSLGATMYTLLTGQLPPDSIQRTTGKTLIKPRTTNPTISTEVENTVLRAMELSASNRFMNATEFSLAIEAGEVSKPVEVHGKVTTESYKAYVGPSGINMVKSGVPNWLYWVIAISLTTIIGVSALYIYFRNKDNTENNRTVTTSGLIETQTFQAEQTFTVKLSPSETSTLYTDTPTPMASETPTISLSPSPTDPEPLLTTIPPIFPLSGTGLVKLTFNDFNYYMPTLSQDQRRLITYANTGENWQVIEIDPNGSGAARQITSESADYHHPHFSNDGQNIIVSSNQTGFYNIYVIDAISGNIYQQLTNDQSTNQTPFWSPDEQNFVFMSNRDGDWEIFLGFMNGSDPIQLTNNNEFDGTSSFSPDGESIAYYSSRAGNKDIYLLDIDSDVERRLTSASGRDAEPAFSPDGNWVVFESDRSGDYDIWAVHITTGELIQITNLPGNEQIPSVSPDGKWVLFQGEENGRYDIFRIPWP